jgi:hypothetical protein
MQQPPHREYGGWFEYRHGLMRGSGNRQLNSGAVSGSPTYWPLESYEPHWTEVEDASESVEGSRQLSLVAMACALLCPILVIFVSYHLKLQIGRQIIISVARTIVQLLLAGFLLLGFIFSLHSPFAVFAYLLLMGLIAALEVTSRQTRTYKGHYLDSLLTVLAGGAGVGIFGTVCVFRPTPWWDPHVMVPTCGMIIGNSISAPAIAVERWFYFILLCTSLFY